MKIPATRVPPTTLLAGGLWLIAAVGWAQVAPGAMGPAEYVLLVSGQKMRADYHNVSGNTVRLYQGGGFVELPVSLVAGYEHIPAGAAFTAFSPDASVASGPALAPEPELATWADASTANGTEAVPVSLSPRQMVHQAAENAGLPPEFVESVALIESGFRPNAISSAGAIGVMQLMPATAARLGADPNDLGQNIEAGTRLLRELLQRYEGDVVKALAAYNAGEGAVDRYKGIPPYRETQHYVNKVINAYIKAGGE